MVNIIHQSEFQTPWEKRERIKQVGGGVGLKEEFFEREISFMINGEEVIGLERHSFDGVAYKLSLTIDEKEVADLNYRVFGNTIQMISSTGGAGVDPIYRNKGIYSRLFYDMTELHPECDLIHSGFGQTNLAVYLENIQKGDDPVTAAKNTPGGRARQKAGFEIDPKRSALTRENAKIVVYRRIKK